jgi:hypothetical protein
MLASRGNRRRGLGYVAGTGKTPAYKQPKKAAENSNPGK